jgi:hypothetical protein
MKSPFSKKKTLAQKVSNTVHLPKLQTLTKHKTLKQKIAKAVAFTLLYTAFFVAGFVLSKIHTLLMVTS